MPNAYITNIASFLPNQPIANDEMESVLGMINGKPSRARRTILRSNGIKSRYYAIDPKTGATTHSNAQLTAEAVRKLDCKQIDCLASGTSIPDQLMPSHAVMVHGELGIPPCEVVCTSGVCLSGITALKYAWMGVLSGEFRHAVATGSETISAMMRGRCFDEEVQANIVALEKRPEIAFEKDFLRWMLSDGAGAVLIEPQPAREGLSLKVEWIIERSYANEMDTCMYAGADKQADGSLKGWREYTPEEWLKKSVFSIKQDVKQLNEHIIHYTVERLLTEVKQLKGIKPDDINWFVPHYSSNFFRERVAEGLRKVNFEIPFERWFTNLDSTGNTGAASIYIMLDELLHSGRLKAGETLLCYVPESGRISSAFMLLTACSAD
ncbi:MAG: hypothetical protein COC05_00750 [Gammaproteobacteria bacterium]|nr:MAG: hypothetical protein COC05_00750 [Gammaproteobacteria bacterium]